MTRPGRILLVSCYELGHAPQGLAWPMAFLERAGFAPEAIDLALEPLDEARVRRAGLVAISTPMHTALRLGVAAARRVRALNPACHVCFHGLYAELNRDWLLAEVADSVLSGECEEALVALARAVERARSGAREAARASQTPPGPVLARLRFPTPSRRGLPPLGRYARLVRDGREVPAGHVVATRGCRHRCLHCPVPAVYRGRVFVVPRDVVLRDAALQVEAGARHVTFGDPDFLNAPEHARRVARALHDRFPEVTFDATVKVEHVVRHGRALFAELRACGLLFVVSAVESLADHVLAILEKRHTRADAERALDVLGAAGVPMRPSFVPFTPWETVGGYLGILEWVAARDLIDHVDAVQYAIRLLVPPGSPLADHDAMRPHLGPLRPEDLTWTWTHPDPRMDALCGDVTRLVEQATRDEAPPRETFARVWALAAAAAGRPARPRLPVARKPPPPRLTEAWFC